MKLVEILARCWKVWQGMDAVEQTCLGDVFCCTRGRACIFGTYEIAEDQDSAVVTREQWEAERDRIAAEEEPKWHIGQDDESWRAECKKQYEQELWDKVAKDTMAAFVSGHTVYYGHESNNWQADALCGVAFDYADAFMAERAKRLQDK